ncbi:MAG: serine acetyltransferase [Clostridiales bacterium]|nr:serine acetyltransferase [Clostridiales bacterium]
MSPAVRAARIQRELEAIKPDCQHQVTTCEEIPDRRDVILVIKDLQTLLFPCFFKVSSSYDDPPGEPFERAEETLTRMIKLALPFAKTPDERDPATLTAAFMELLPRIKKQLVGDANAIYQGDPAANSCEEVLICYPGFYAISIHRFAHELYRMNIPIIPRIMSEYAHTQTGIDIHPGATIGERFCIDHGTGTVIGETARIGNNVKLYQGVTLGAKSFALDEQGNPIKGIKRHPDIGDRVVVYANAVILGGDTVIGSDSVIGGSVWLTNSVPEGSVIYYDSQASVKQR